MNGNRGVQRCRQPPRTKAHAGQRHAGLTGHGDKLTDPLLSCFECGLEIGTFTLAANAGAVSREIGHGRRPRGEACQTRDNVGGSRPQGRVLLKHLEEQVIELGTAP